MSRERHGIHSSHFTPSHLTSKFTRWQSLREPFKGVADFLKAKRNKTKYKERSEKVEWEKKSQEEIRGQKHVF